MSGEVRSMLRSAGWSGFDANGCEIEYWVQNPDGDSVGIVRDRDGRMLLGRTWTADGECVGYGHDLVGLPSSVPAPVAVRDDRGPTENCPVPQHVLDGILYSRWGVTPDQGKRMAREIVESRKRISELEAWRDNANDQIQSRDRVAATMHNQIRELEAERDELMELRRCTLLELMKSTDTKSCGDNTAPVNPFAIIDDRKNWFYRFKQATTIHTTAPGRRTVNGVPFIQMGSSWVALSDMLASWERSESLTGPWEPVQ